MCVEKLKKKKNGTLSLKKTNIKQFGNSQAWILFETIGILNTVNFMCILILIILQVELICEIIMHKKIYLH